MVILNIFVFQIFYGIILAKSNDNNKKLPEAIVCRGQCSPDDATIFEKQLQSLLQNPVDYISNRSGHAVYDFLTPFYNCPGKIARYPPNQLVDGGKYVCEPLSKYENGKAIVYSIGSANDFSWETEMKEKFAPQIYTFDCSWKKNWKIPSFVSFHPFCLDDKDQGNNYKLSSIMEKLGHQKIDFLKVDIEGAEFRALTDLKNIQPDNLPSQIALELHHTIKQHMSIDQKVAAFQKILNLYDLLHQLGYKLMSREDNYQCLCCTEILLLR